MKFRGTASKLTHEELCERARRWLAGTRRCEPVFSNIASCNEIPDAIGWSSSWQWRGSTVIECKTCRGDFYADLRKYRAFENPETGLRLPVGRVSQKLAERLLFKSVRLAAMGDFRFYMCQPDVLTSDMVETHASDHGLLYVESARRITIVRPAARRASEFIDKDGEIRYLRFAIINRKAPFAIPVAAEASL